MFTLFMALATCDGEKYNFLTIQFQAFEIFPHTFNQKFPSKAQFTSGPKFMCLKGLHIANLKHNKRLRFELPSSKALITHLHSKASIASSRSMRPRQIQYTYSCNNQTCLPQLQHINHLQPINNSKVKTYISLSFLLCPPTQYANKKLQG